METSAQKRRFVINALSSAAQSLIVAATLFLLYRFLLRTIRVEEIGVWSIVFAAASLSKLAELGISNGVVKFVAGSLARQDYKQAAETVRTAAISTGAGIGVILLLGYFASPLFLPLIVGKDFVSTANSVLHLALISFWLNSVASVYQSGLDGCQRMDLRAWLNVAATVLHFTLCFILAPRYGLYGLALSQVIQALVLLSGNILILGNVLPSLSYKIVGWERERFRELLRYGLNAQAASVSITLLAEPITKAFIVNFGGLAFIAFYDMANRMISQLRSVILSAYQAMVPMVSQISESGGDIRPLYHRSVNVMMICALPLFSAIISFSPLISQLWIGREEAAFVQSNVILSIGWCVNTLIVPAYMINLGTGALRWNTWSHVIIGAVNIIAGYVLALSFGASGAVLGWSLALFCGSLILLWRFHQEYSIDTQRFFDHDNIVLLLCSVAAGVLITLSYRIPLPALSPVAATALRALVFCLVLCPAVLLHKAPRHFLGFVGTHLAK